MTDTAGVARHVNGERLWRRLMELARFGATAKGGVSRLALTEEEVAARAQLVSWGAAIGLEPSVDPASNLFLRLTGTDPGLPPLLIGSHTDSQPTGGKFDGAYGVVAALEALEAIKASGQKHRRAIELVAWMNEEGSRFAPGMMGSAVFTGVRRLDEIRPLKDKAGISVGDALDQLLAREAHLPRRALGFKAAGFVEAHIEQGITLQNERLTIGVVTGIQGKRTFRIEVEGEESHAGTSARADRKDALVSAVAIVDALQKAMWDKEDTVRFTIGMFTVTPNAPSVVPGRVVFSVDLRHGDPDTVKRLGDAIPGICEAARGACAVQVRELLYDVPLQFPKSMRDLISETAQRLKLSHRELPSPAGHDSRYLHYVCPTGMIFIPCKDGISHNEAEDITPSDATAGARVLADVALALANADSPND
ncbi:Zn-dependent hydrolase [Bradyrhizobium sp. NP1]|uniref:Zn-dependent hydrolase n=1 Tax=Bradyrhizobium sp. NP1 TaxID=3049772 RepID=UPI0025A67DCA|nr:Zn-dependent hydrolase [Bradyrhizobium sp. NP1]WJR76664.1 Zn-dependent hydrolase [Bradyrhizobium sp. NP1]